jgi:hypothetical protein
MRVTLKETSLGVPLVAGFRPFQPLCFSQWKSIILSSPPFIQLRLLRVVLACRKMTTYLWFETGTNLAYHLPTPEHG